MIKRLLLIATLLLCSFCMQQANADERVSNKNAAVFYSVSLLTLITNPAEYDGKVVQVEGVFEFYFSESALFASVEWYKHSIFRNSVTLRLDVKAKEIDKLNSWTGRYVEVRGVFDAKDRGHLGGSSGTIKEVSYLHLMNEPIVGSSESDGELRQKR